jgi:hypothetical protein
MRLVGSSGPPLPSPSFILLFLCAQTHRAAVAAFPCADGVGYWLETYSDLKTLIGEDEGGVGGGELGVRHCWWNRAVSCLGRYRSVRIRASTQRICWSSKEVLRSSRSCGLSNSIGGPLGGGAGAASLASARVMCRVGLQFRFLGCYPSFCSRLEHLSVLDAVRFLILEPIGLGPSIESTNCIRSFRRTRITFDARVTVVLERHPEREEPNDHVDHHREEGFDYSSVQHLAPVSVGC